MRHWFGRALLAAVLFAPAGTLSRLKLNAVDGDPHFVPAYFDRGDGAGKYVLTLFPLTPGTPMDVALPAGLATVINLIAFAPDGRSVYLQEPAAAVVNRSDALVKIELRPLRQGPVPGSGGLGDIFSLTVSPQSGRIFVLASGGRGQQCGAYE